MTTLGPRLRSKSNEDRRFKAIRALEAGLHARWKAVVHEMSEGHKGPSERVRKAAEEDLERTAVPVPTPHPTIPEDIHSKLLDALEGVTVRAVVGLRGLTEVPPNVEAVTLAVLHLVSCEYLGQMGLGPEAPENWEEARRVLLKPGHFVSSLRKFPSSLEQGQVNDSNIIFAQKKLLQIGNAASTGLAEVHEGAVQLYHWLRAALQLAPSSLVAAAASPARASASPLDPLQPAYPRSAPSSPQHKKEEVKPSPSKTTPKAAPVRWAVRFPHMGVWCFRFVAGRCLQKRHIVPHWQPRAAELQIGDLIQFAQHVKLEGLTFLLELPPLCLRC